MWCAVIWSTAVDAYTTNASVDSASTPSRAARKRRSGGRATHRVTAAAAAKAAGATSHPAGCGHQNHSAYLTAWVRLWPESWPDRR